jgi:hypothetical protein
LEEDFKGPNEEKWDAIGLECAKDFRGRGERDDGDERIVEKAWVEGRFYVIQQLVYELEKLCRPLYPTISTLPPCFAILIA